MPPFVHLAAGCRPEGYWDGMNLWREWGMNFFPRLADKICHTLGGARPGGWPDWTIFFVLGLLGSFVLVNVAAMAVPYVVLLERKLIGRFQHRVGPNRVGIFGILQPIADAMKLMTKEDITPRAADKLVFALAPLAFAVPVLLMFAPLPWSRHASLAGLDVGILYVVAVTGAAEVAVFMAGWSSNNKYALFGSMRAVAMLVSYEIPLVLAIVGVVLLADSLNLEAIVESQKSIPNLLWQPLGFIVFAVAVTAELNRAPFDLLEADSEIVAGFHTEYSGMRWGLIQLGEYAALIGFSGIITTLFLAGYRGPYPIPGYIWFVFKLALVIAVFIWVRATIPRLRIDQIMAVGWKFLLPLALLNIFVMAAEVVGYPDGLPKWLIAVNIGVAVIAIGGMVRLLGFKGRTRQVLQPAVRPIGAAGSTGTQTVARGG